MNQRSNFCTIVLWYGGREGEVTLRVDVTTVALRERHAANDAQLCWREGEVTLRVDDTTVALWKMSVANNA